MGSKIFNFNKFFNNRDVKTFLDSSSILLGERKCFPFVDKDHNHVITSNLNIITNNKLCKRFSNSQSTKKMVLMNMKKLSLE